MRNGAGTICFKAPAAAECYLHTRPAPKISITSHHFCHIDGIKVFPSGERTKNHIKGDSHNLRITRLGEPIHIHTTFLYRQDVADGASGVSRTGGLAELSRVVGMSG